MLIFGEKDANISKIKAALALKKIISKSTYVCECKYQISSF